jgi:rhodanese-related sulfurtransferase
VVRSIRASYPAVRLRYRRVVHRIVPEVPTITVTEAEQRQAEGARLIDVRERVEFDAVRVPGSELMPMSTIQEWYTGLRPDEELMVLCRSGNRSASVVNALIEQADFTNVVNVAGGIIAWSEAGLPIEVEP